MEKEAKNTKPKILVFSMGFDPFIGGAEIAITELTKRLSAYYEFHIITCRIDSNLPRYEDKDYIKVYRVGLHKPGADNTEFSQWPLKLNKWLFPFLAYVKGLPLHRKHKFAGHWCMLAFTGAIGSLLFKLTFPKVKYVLELQDGRSYEERKKTFGPIIFPVIQKSFQRADFIKTISTFQIGVAKKMGATAPIVRIPNGVDVDIFTKEVAPSDKEEIRSKLNLKPDTKYLISTTRLVARRGHEALIGSLAHLPENYQLILCGSGPLKETLEDLATRLSVIDRIVWAGDVPYAEIPKYLAVADVFVRPSIYEGMGNSFIEAFAFGLPVVGTPVGGIIDFLFDDEKNPHPNGIKTGYLANVDDPIDLANQIQKIFIDPTDSQNRISEAQTLALLEHDWDQVAENFHQKIWSPLLR